MRKRPIGERTIDEATARRIAVQLNCDPRTVRKALRGEVKSLAALKAQKALIEAGLLDDELLRATG